MEGHDDISDVIRINYNLYSFHAAMCPVCPSLLRHVHETLSRAV